MKRYIVIYIICLSILSGKTIEDLQSAFEASISAEDSEALLSLYHTTGYDRASLELLESSIQRTLGIKELSKSFTVSHIETLNYSNFGAGTDGEKIAYYPAKYLSGAFYLAYHYKERSGRGLRTFPIIHVDGEYYLAARKIEDLGNKAEKKFYSISLKDDHYQTFAPIFVTYSVGNLIQMKTLPGRHGQLFFSELLSISCPPIPTATEATLLVVNPKDKDDVLLELDFNPQFGLYWQNQNNYQIRR